MEKKQPQSLLDKCTGAAAIYANLSLALLAAFLLLRIMELLSLASAHEIPEDFGAVIGTAFFFDCVFFLKMMPPLFLPFLAMALMFENKRSHFWGYGITGTCVILAYGILIEYFATAMVPLGADLFGYSMDDILLVAGASGNFDLPVAAFLAFPIAGFWMLLAFLHRRHLLRPAHAAVLLGGGVVVAIFVSALPGSATFKSDFSYNMALNKAAFFEEKSFAYLMRGNAIAPVASNSDTGFKYLDPDYPFLRTDETPDVLGELFNIDPNTPPNIVFIQVEGLGRAFSGPDAYLGSFTPFLDELAEKSLYWENFLASQGRTFASLPSILGSLPFADRGFNDLGEKMPAHFTLLSILKKNGYRANFYCGENLAFDNQGEFLERQGIDGIVGINDYDKSYIKIPRSTWGYQDRELMLKTLKSEEGSSEPHIVFLQTISMHTPYTVPDQKKYEALFEERLDQLGLDVDRRARRLKDRNIYSTIMYTDDAIRLLIEEYARRPSFARTIFIITGDHRLPEIPMSTKIDRYHVPLIIYSPMLKKPERIKSISSHLDITPSLVSFLKKNYGIRAPSSVAWVGSGLDTDPSFRNVHKAPLKHTTSNLHNFISGLYFLDDGQLFSVEEKMDLEPIEDDAKLSELTAELNTYKAMNDRFTRDLNLLPEDVYTAFR